MIRWSPNSWKESTRSAKRLPLNLSEAYDRCRNLALTYGDLIDAWEIENEPDIQFVPETAESFAAFYKACSLGILSGREAAEVQAGKRKTEDGQGRPSDLIGAADTFPPSHLSTTRASSAVMHSPLALPPGPYWQELVANDTLSYTEAFNYHYYGFAEDFHGVRDAWIAALEAAQRVGQPTVGPATAGSKSTASKVGGAEGADPSTLSATADNLQAKPVPSDLLTSSKTPALPLFLTEYGYGLLDRFDRNTVAGRGRQKRFFETTLPVITDGTITGAMAFVFKPYLSAIGRNDFGMLAEVPEDLRSVLLEQQSRKVSSAPSKYESKSTKNPLTSPLAEGSHLISATDIFPLLTNGLRPSPVVIDFIAGKRTRSIKRYNGHILQRRESATSSGDLTLVIYNFSNEPITGTLSVRLENGEIESRLSQEDDGSMAENEAKAGVTKSSDLKTLRPSDLKTAEAKPAPYRRPDTPRSGFNPPTEPDWPNADTRIITTNSGKTYAITPALEFLLSAVTQNGEASVATPETAENPVAGVGDPGIHNPMTKTGLTEASYNNAPRSELRTVDEPGHGSSREFDPAVAGLHSAQRSLSAEASAKEDQPFSVSNISLAPMERRELRFTATLPNSEFRPHRLWATWDPEKKTTLSAEADALTEHQVLSNLPTAESRLATQLYPSPAAFRFETLNRFDFPAKANATSRALQLTRPRAEEEAALQLNPSAPRWLTTPGVEIKETKTGWRITINDLPPEPLRPAEIELSLPEGFLKNLIPQAVSGSEPDATFRPSDFGPSDRGVDPRSAIALSLKYRLILPDQNLPTSPSAGRSDESADLSAEALAKEEDATAPNRYEELEINFRDTNGTLWGVWPRLSARNVWQSYLEPLGNFTPMFYSRAPLAGSSLNLPLPSSTEARSLVLLFRPRVLPTVIEIQFPRLVHFVPQ